MSNACLIWHVSFPVTALGVHTKTRVLCLMPYKYPQNPMSHLSFQNRSPATLGFGRALPVPYGERHTGSGIIATSRLSASLVSGVLFKFSLLSEAACCNIGITLSKHLMLQPECRACECIANYSVVVRYDSNRQHHLVPGRSR